MAGPPELSVVCKSCGSEVSPYVTECPYCGMRLRKRAPRIERQGGDIRFDDVVEAPSRPRRRRSDRRPSPRRRLPWPRVGLGPLAGIAERPWLIGLAVLGPAVLILVERALALDAFEAGAVAVGQTPADDWWRYLAAPWVYVDIGVFAVCAVAIALCGRAVESRIGTALTAAVMVGSGALGMLATDLAGVGGLVAGGNGVALALLAAWFLMARAEPSDYAEDAPDPILAAVGAVVLLALPLVDSLAGGLVGLVGLLCGALVGLLAGRLRGRVA